jgi:hypothetical protein
MKFKIIFTFVISVFLFGCKKSERIPEPISYQQEPAQEVKVVTPDQIYTADGVLISTEQSLKDELNKRALGKIRELTPKENEFVCNCVIEDVRNSKDSDSILLISLNKCNALLKKQRQENPDFYFYSKDGDFIGTKPTVKIKIKKELKDAKVKDISDALMNDIMDCLGKRYRTMTTKEINDHNNIFLECMMDNYPKTTKE